MSQIEAETQWLRDEILLKILKGGRLVEEYSEAKADTFQVGDIEIDVIGSSEAFMLTFCYRATINFQYDGKQFQRKMVVKKTPPLPPFIYEAIQFNALFSNEINFYTQILPEIQKLADGTFAAPKFYYSEVNPHSAVAIFENFAEQGWRVTKDRFGLSLAHAKIAVKYLGRFHGFAYALKHKSPELFAQLSGNLQESRFATESMDPQWKLTLDASIDRAEKVVTTYQPQIDGAYFKKYRQLVTDHFQYGKQRVAPREPLATLCHGDFLRNNVAYRYNDKEEPLEIMMFDYQTLRISSPMIDLSVFLAISLLAEVRYSNFDAIFDDYCSALAESYQQHAKAEVPEFLSRSELLKEYVRFLPYSVTITASFLATLVVPMTISLEEMLSNPESDEAIIERTMTTGGELVDREIAHQFKEMLELSQQCNVSIDDGIDLSLLRTAQ